jgi:methylated-DNA-protein-cysteine methyltransferase-like protein
MRDKASFFEDVYEVVKLIPYGRVSTYGSIASYLGAKGSARMVGWALNMAHAHPDVPAHRVVNHQGLLTGKHHFPTPTAMEERLSLEGIEVENDKIKYFSNLYWDPQQNLI